MYHGGVLNGEINRILGNLRHTDRICIADCGLPARRRGGSGPLRATGAAFLLDVLKEITEHFDAEKSFWLTRSKSRTRPFTVHCKNSLQTFPQNWSPRGV